MTTQEKIDAIAIYLADEACDVEEVLNLWEDYCHYGEGNGAWLNMRDFNQYESDTHDRLGLIKSAYLSNGKFNPFSDYYRWTDDGVLESCREWELKDRIDLIALARFIVEWGGYGSIDPVIDEILDV